MAKAKIYCVDDNLANLKLLRRSLKDYDCELFESAGEMFHRLEQQVADLVLLDVMMPVIDGIEACKLLRERSFESYLPVIFVSAKYEIQDKLRGYDAGGDDYIAKPFNQEELKAKVEATLKRKQQFDASRREVKDSRELISCLHETSYVVNFLQNALSAVSVEQVVKLMQDALQNYGLSAIIESVFEGRRQLHHSDGISNAMESSVIDFVRNKGRLVSFGSKVSINYPHLTIIIKNMPDDEILRGRLRDHLALIGKGADSRLATIEKEKHARDRFNMLIEFMDELKTMLAQLDDSYEKHKVFSEEVLSKVGEELEDSYMHMGLTEVQEEELRQIVSQSEQLIIKQNDDFSTVHRQFSSMHRQMDTVLQHTLSLVDQDLKDDADDEMVVLF